MTIEEKIRPFITASHKGDTFGAAAGNGDSEMLSYAKQEIARLRQPGNQRTLAEHDHESRIRCQALERLVSLWETPA